MTINEYMKKLRNDGRLKKIPVFLYHPNPFLTGAFEELEEPDICGCCGNETRIVYSNPFYYIEEVECLCPECIAGGRALPIIRQREISVG